MTHKLRITIRIDIDLLSVCVVVHGCVTEENCAALLPIVRRSHHLLRGSAVTIDASSAQHIDVGGVDALRGLGIAIIGRDGPEPRSLSQDESGTAAGIGACSLLVPDILPACPSYRTAAAPRPYAA